MLERAALHQTRYRTPGVSPDARGVVLGQLGAVLFPSLDRLVAFLRAYGDEGSLDEILPTLTIRQLRTPLNTKELLLTLTAESSYRMDRIAGVAKLAGGLVFTGTSRHFVKYRDSVSPLGYDVRQLLDARGDVVLYHDTFQQPYAYEREIAFRELVFKLQPYRRPVDEDETPPKLWASAELGIGGAILTYLFRWQIEARAALAEWPPSSAFDDKPRRLHLFDISEAPARVARLLASLPGVHVFEPFGKTVAVERGYRHPIALESCASIFPDDALHLFLGSGEVLVASPIPPFAPVRSLVRTSVGIDDPTLAATGAGRDETWAMRLPLKLTYSSDPWRAVIASAVPRAKSDWLGRMLYALPPRVLASLQIAATEDYFYLLDRTGIEGVPLGTFFSEVANRIYIPSGLKLVPAVAPGVLEELVSVQGAHIFFHPHPQGASAVPTAVPESAFGPASRSALRESRASSVQAEPLRIETADLPLLAYDSPTRFPMWGLPDGEGEG